MAVMNRMRENTKTILMILVVAFMLTIIIDWGMGGFKSSAPKGVIAEVNGNEIAYNEFYQVYQNEIAAYRDQYGSEPQEQDLQQIEDRVFENLVQRYLMTEVINNMNLTATDEEIVEGIYNDPPALLRNEAVFQDSTGAFDMERYKSALDNPSADPYWDNVVQYLRASIPMEKLGDLVTSAVIVTDDQARVEYMRTHMKAKIDYVMYSAAEFAADVPQPTDVEIKKYYDQNKEEFHETATRVLNYVLLELKPTTADSQRVFEEVNDLIREIKNGKDFAELAKIYSEDPGTAGKGGDLGYFAPGQMVKPFEDAAFAANKGEVVGPVKSQFGLHIIKVEDKKREKDEPQVKASHILLKFEPSPSTREALREEANYIAEYAKESVLKTVAEAEGFKIQETPPFIEGNFIPGIGMERRINRFAFRNKEGAASDVFTTDRGFLVTEVAKITPDQYKPLEDAKSTIINKLQNEKRLELAQKAAEQAFEKLGSGMSFDQVAKQDSLDIKQTEQFDMNAYVVGIGSSPEIAGQAFRLQVGEFSRPIKTDRGFYIIQLVEKTDFSEQEFQKQKESIKKEIASREQPMVFRQWYAKVKEKADIKDYRSDYL